VNSTGTYIVNLGVCAKAIAVLTTQDTYANTAYLNESVYASCLYDCPNGITYYQDPSAYMTNIGHNWMFLCKNFGQSAASPAITCTQTELAVDMALSTATSIAVTDATASTCGGTAVLTVDGDQVVTVTPSPVSPVSGGVATITLANTWTQSTASQAIGCQAILTNANYYPVYEFLVGTFTMQIGNTLTITDTLTAT
jgi:hypothetical protein